MVHRAHKNRTNEYYFTPPVLVHQSSHSIKKYPVIVSKIDFQYIWIAMGILSVT